MHSEFIQKRSLSARFYLASILFGSLVLARVELAAGDNLVRVTDLQHITDPVMISNVSVGGRPIECGLFIKPPAVLQPVSPFQASGSWLRQMSLSLVNRTEKTIVFGGIYLDFLDTGDCHAAPCVGAELRFGRRPTVDGYDGRSGRPLRPENPERPLLDWKPGETIRINVSDYMPEIEADLANFFSVESVTKVNVHRAVFYFDDGMEWALGRYSIPDAGHPGQFKGLPANYFPGRRGHNWPPGYNN